MRMFFDYVIVIEVWKIISSLTSIEHVTYECMARWWVSNKKNQANNLVHAATLWAIRRCRNDLCFNKNTWLCLHVILRKIAVACYEWKIMCVEHAKGRMEEINAFMYFCKFNSIAKMGWAIYQFSGNKKMVSSISPLHLHRLPRIFPATCLRRSHGEPSSRTRPRSFVSRRLILLCFFWQFNSITKWTCSLSSGRKQEKRCRIFLPFAFVLASPLKASCHLIFFS